MYKIIQTILLVSFLLGLSLQMYAQEVPDTSDTLYLSLNDIWQKAEKNSRGIDVKTINERIKEDEIKDAQMERFPEWNVAGSVEKATNMPIYDNGLFSKPSQHEIIHTLYKVGTDFYLNLYNGNKLNLKIAQDKTLHQIAAIERDETTSNIKYKAASLFLDLQKSYVFRDLAVQDIADQEKQLEEIKALDKNGVVLKSDVLRVELDLSKRKLLLVQIENDIVIANLKLNILIGEPDERIIVPKGIDYKDMGLDESYEVCLQQAMQHSYAYHISEKEAELSALKLKDVKANVRPKVGMYGEFYYANPQIFIYPYNPYWYSLGIAGVKVSFPISSLYHNVYKTRAAKLELEQEEVRHLDTEDKIRQQVKEAYLRYKEILVKVEVDKVNVTQAMENARIIKNTYFNQTSLITDLLDADVQVLQTKFELAAASILAQDKYYLLQNIIGKL